MTATARLADYRDDMATIPCPPHVLSWRSILAEFIVRALLIALFPTIGLFFPRPFERRVIGPSWANYAFPYNAQDRVPFHNLLWSGSVGPVGVAFLVIFMVQFRRGGAYPLYAVFAETYRFILGHSLSILASETVTSLIKNSFGQLRPDFLSRCLGTSDVPQWMHARSLSWSNLPAVPVCNPNVSSRVVADGRMSFPSGHSSFTAASFGFLAVWLYCRGPFNCQNTHAPSLRIMLTAATILVPIGVGISRTKDYRHHPSDVLGGLILGFLFAIFSHRAYYTQTSTFRQPSYNHDHKYRLNSTRPRMEIGKTNEQGTSVFSGSPTNTINV